jgi:hypothetical protein
VLLSTLIRNSEHEILYHQIKSFEVRELKKYIEFLRSLEGESTLVIVMSPSHIITLLTKMVFSGVVILDAGWPLSDSSEIRKGKFSLSYMRDTLIDRISMTFADLVFLESEQQRNYLVGKWKKLQSKLEVIYTGLKEERFQVYQKTCPPSRNSQDKKKLKVVFRGKYNSETGLNFIQEIFTERLDSYTLTICCPDLPNTFRRIEGITYLTDSLTDGKLSEIYNKADLALGQFGVSNRIQRSIAHKIFEYAYFGIPTVCLVGSAAQEIFDGDEFYFVSRENLASLLDSFSSNYEEFKKEQKRRSESIKIKYQLICSEAAINKKVSGILKNNFGNKFPRV